jgi:hypothetical protein
MGGRRKELLPIFFEEKQVKVLQYQELSVYLQHEPNKNKEV